MAELKTYEGYIDTLDPHEIYTFGANTEGRHSKGSALVARTNFGAVYGQSRGLQGQSYAIITKDLKKKQHPSISPEYIKAEIRDLYTFARLRVDLLFYVVYRGEPETVNLNHYTPLEMASFFAAHEVPNNVVFEKKFSELMKPFLKSYVEEEK